MEISLPLNSGRLQVPIALSCNSVLEGLWIVSGSIMCAVKHLSWINGTTDKSFSSPCVPLHRCYVSQIWKVELKWWAVYSSYLPKRVECCIIQSCILGCTKVEPSCNFFHISNAAGHHALIDVVVMYWLLHSCRLCLSKLWMTLSLVAAYSFLKEDWGERLAVMVSLLSC